MPLLRLPPLLPPLPPSPRHDRIDAAAELAISPPPLFRLRYRRRFAIVYQLHFSPAAIADRHAAFILFSCYIIITHAASIIIAAMYFFFSPLIHTAILFSFRHYFRRISPPCRCRHMIMLTSAAITPYAIDYVAAIMISIYAIAADGHCAA